MVTGRSIIVFSVIIVAVILFAVGLVTAVYFTVYKRHINKTLMYGDSGAEQQNIRRMPSVGSASPEVAFGATVKITSTVCVDISYSPALMSEDVTMLFASFIFSSV